MSKIWNPIRELLINRESLYFCAGSLCVDYKTTNGTSYICLHIDGRACTLEHKSFPQPADVTKLVDDIYLETKGMTQYYVEDSITYKERDIVKFHVYDEPELVYDYNVETGYALWFKPDGGVGMVFYPNHLADKLFENGTWIKIN